MHPASDQPSDDPARSRFLALLAAPWSRLVLARPQGAEADLQRITVRPLVLKGQACLSFVHTHTTRDVTKNLPVAEGLAQVGAWIGRPFRNAHLFTDTAEVQLKIGKKGTGHVSTQALPASLAAAPGAPTAPTAPAPHDREKQRWLSLDRPFLTALGVTTPQHQLVPAMARKWKQINKFIEVFAHALAHSPLADASALRVVDFGAGKAYLSFAIHDWLRHTRGLQAEVIGVELRPDLVAQGRQTIRALGLHGMHVEQGDVRDWRAGPMNGMHGTDIMNVMDVMIALHACDTATDHAIHLGIRAGAQIILCSPCCHKQLRPQLLSPHPLRSVFQHGIHAEQQAEMVTDSLRALLLDAQGYDTRVFEFISLEHTAKNKMILAVKRREAGAPDAALRQVAELKQFFGVREHCLETLLQAPAG